MISCSLSPNTEHDDIVVALRQFFFPRTKSSELVEQWFQKKYRGRVYLFNSGRSALYAMLQAFGIGKCDEVIIQAFTCVAVPNAVLWTGATPVYCDIDENYNLEVSILEQKITRKTKAIIVQHTFGIPARIKEILSIAKTHNIVVIEDCAHALGNTVQGRLLGTFGDAAFFSFGRDKVVSSVWGGASIINAKCQMPNAKLKLKQIHKDLPYPSEFWIFQQLLHPVAFSLILPLYQSGLGKLLLVLLQKIKLLSFPVYPEEKQGKQPAEFPKKFPDALAGLLVHQLNKLDRYRKERHSTSTYFGKRFKRSDLVSKENGLIRFPLLVDDPGGIIAAAKKQGILLGNWYHHVIDPSGVNLDVVGYKKGSCPKAENVAQHIINFPTRISQNDAERVVSVFI